MQIEFADDTPPREGTLLLTVAEGLAFGPRGAALDKSLDGLLARIAAAAGFTAKKDETLVVAAPHGSQLERVVLFGLGDPAKLTATALEATGGALFAHLRGTGVKRAHLLVDKLEGLTLAPAEAVASILLGARLRAYRFDKYRTRKPRDDKPDPEALTVGVNGAAAARSAWDLASPVAEALYVTRDVVSEPPNVLYPATYAARIRDTLTPLGVTVEILEPARMAELGMGALLGVGQGAVHEPRVVVMRWQGAADPQAAPVALVGKGVCFDSGGISIKPADGMWDMKWDMAGSAAVYGALHLLARRKARANVVGIVGLVENMPDGNAQRPGDVVKSMSGQTIEVQNTDAEGRLVLADVLWYVQETYQPKAIVDLATLTGAVMIALGLDYAGVMANDEALIEELRKAGAEVGEKLWALPLDDEFDRMIDSDIADMKNISGTRNAGTIVGGQFIKRFVKDGVRWAHLDIAGVAWWAKDKPTIPKGATGWGVRTLDRWIRQNYEG